MPPLLVLLIQKSFTLLSLQVKFSYNTIYLFEGPFFVGQDRLLFAPQQEAAAFSCAESGYTGADRRSVSIYEEIMSIRRPVFIRRTTAHFGPGDTYTGPVTLVQLSACILGDRNKMSYDAGISYIRNVLEATRTLQKNPNDLDARGIIMLGASLSTSSRLGIGKEKTFAYDIYKLEFLPEQLFGSTYRRSLTSVFPRFLDAMGKHHAEEIVKYYRDAFGFDSSIEESSQKLIELFAGLSVEMYYDGSITREQVDSIPCNTELGEEEVFEMMDALIRR